MSGRSSASPLAVLLLAAMIGTAFVAWLDVPEQPRPPIVSRPVDVNAAGVDRLSLLPGIGPMLAERIVDDRARHGRFTSIDALERVPGVGPRTVERVREAAVVEREWGSGVRDRGSGRKDG